MDAYVLSLISESDASIDEERHTLGVRFSGPIASSKHFSFDVESAVQLGKQDDIDIFAWMLTAEATYRRADFRLTPWFTMGVDIASGDDDPTDRVTETFDQLFPLGHAYLGYIDVVGRQNIIDVRATAGIWPPKKKLMIRAAAHFFFRANEGDGLYNAGGGLVRSPDDKNGAKGTSAPSSGGPAPNPPVGVELDLTAKYISNRYANVQFG